MKKTINLSQWQLTRPEHLRWYFPKITNSSQILEQIRSEKFRKYLKGATELIREFRITVKSSVLTRESYLSWLEHYNRVVDQKSFNAYATADWYDLKISEGKAVESMTFYQNTELVGSKVYTLINNTVIAAFKTTVTDSLEFTKKIPFGALMDYIFLEKMIDRKIEKLNFGRSRNQFGIDNRLGLLEYKLKFGMYPLPDVKKDIVSSLIEVDPEKTVMSFCFNAKQELALYAFISNHNKLDAEPSQYLPKKYPFFIINY